MLKFIKALPIIRSTSVRSITVSASAWKEVDMVDMPDNSLPIPKYQQKENETVDVKKARLIYQSRKRGMLENCLLLSTFAAQHLATFNDKQLDLYDNLINQPTNDWDIYYYATNVKPIPAEYDNEIMDMLKKHASNEQREQRLRQPDL